MKTPRELVIGERAQPIHCYPTVVNTESRAQVALNGHDRLRVTAIINGGKTRFFEPDLTS